MRKFDWTQGTDENSIVYLRPANEADGEEYIDLVKASHDFLHPWVDPPNDLDAYCAIVEKTKGPENVSLLVCMTLDERIAGSVNMSQICFGSFCSAYLGYWIAKEYAGRGLMTAALQDFVRLALGPFGLHRLEANIQPANTLSKKLVERVGFQKEGMSPKYLKINDVWEDHERWAIRAENLRLSPHSSSDS